MPAHPLDRPVWSALTTGWAKFAQGGPGAMRLAPEYGPFAAASNPQAPDALAALNFGDAGIWTVEIEETPPPRGATIVLAAPTWQMMAEDVTEAPVDFEIVDLDDKDGPDMLALTTLTQPGPFYGGTHRLGRFVGVKEKGRLIAMAGERMRPAGFTEVSAVCTLPEHRGKGYAAGLMRLVTKRILARGEMAFLHTYESNTGAISLYESLGFRHRATVIATVLKRA